MSLQGKILKLHNKNQRAIVSVKPVANCNGCKACAGLIKASNASQTEQEIEVLTNNFDVKIGDIVQLELTEFQGSKAAFLIYGIPIIFFLVGLSLTPYICNLISIPTTDGARVICAITSMLLSMQITMIYLRLKRPDTFIMQVTKVITD